MSKLKVLDIRPAGISITLEFSQEELDMLHNFLANSTVEYDSESESDLADAVKYVTKGLYPDLTFLLAEVRRDYGT